MDRCLSTDRPLTSNVYATRLAQDEMTRSVLVHHVDKMTYHAYRCLGGNPVGKARETHRQILSPTKQAVQSRATLLQ